MEPTTSPATSSPSHQSRSTPGSHRRALTVDLMELLDTNETEDKGWAAAKGETAAYAAFDPQRLWRAPNGEVDGEAGTHEDFHGVMIVFVDGPPGGDTGLASVDSDASFNGPVLRFLLSRTDFLKHLQSSPVPRCSPAYNHNEEEEEARGRDGVGSVLLFTDVKVEGIEDDRTLSVVYVQLTKEWRQAVDRVAVQRRAAQVIDAAQSLSPNASQATFWVDFTGILDTKGSSHPHEVRDAWWDLAVTSASTLSAPRVTVLVDPAVVPGLLQEASKAGREAVHHVTAETNLSGLAEPLWTLCGRHAFENLQTVNNGSEESHVSPAKPLVFEHDNEDDKKSDDDDGEGDGDEDELIWKKYMHVAMKDMNDRTARAAPFGPPVGEEAGSEENELLWKKCMHVVEVDAEDGLVAASHGCSCLFLECTGDSYASSLGDNASIRELLVSWSSLGLPHSPRTVVVIADDNQLENTLLSWVRVPWCQNALILSVFGVSELVTHHDSQQDVVLPPLLVAASLTMTSEDAFASGMFFRILTFAVQYFGIDVCRSACLTLTRPFLRAAESLGFQVVGDYTRVCAWALQSRAEVAAAQGLLDVDRERERLFTELCATNALARALRGSPRRPEILIRRMGSMRVGIVRPVVCDAVALAPRCPAGARDERWFDAVLPLSPEQRRRVYRYMAAFFTKDVFRTAVDIVQSCASDYFSGYHFAAIGYLRYEMSSCVRRHVFAELQVDLHPLLAGDQLDAGAAAEPHWSRVFRRLSCTCTPRRHERLLRTETGEKKCRHLMQLLYWFLRPRPSGTTAPPPQRLS
ncbi:hypothetical protein TraAM80_01487 [Trypanosoma rangeli]|uniref:Uncharacterized protein n=1 Tax=Trypanosoma rangeli TaxID=5698 RepID=A0A422NYI0_TRYRA|nr:uncharacterized protein TraAM80_01487 [Trypanosoma rangeli]RNF10562.1 hypothetical protein TraAM80_01487 [Trypanosoma rangeli]|eukprot:RNF10562.1 hypothetical protein TraAM80_01487 [Trypanosoma rangeli]